MKALVLHSWLVLMRFHACVVCVCVMHQCMYASNVGERMRVHVGDPSMHACP